MTMSIILAVLSLGVLFSGCPAVLWSRLNLMDEHIPYVFNGQPHLAEACKHDSACPYQHHIKADVCWGYELNCSKENATIWHECPGSSKGWTSTKDEQLDMFWTQADFGYVKLRLDNMAVICEAQQQGDSSLVCTSHTEYCRATNLFMDFRGLMSTRKHSRYREDIFSTGQIGGHCKMDAARLASFGQRKSPLQSWYAELEKYAALDFHPIKDKKCDIVIDKPTIFMKLDAGINMFHHFCDFINLYASQHINGSLNTDINILMWDTSQSDYYDLFDETWKVFTDHPVIHLRQFDGKKVCFRDAVFSLLPRMVFGLYYNMPLVPGCHKSHLMRAFSQHVVHRMGLKQNGPLKQKIRITLLSRSSQYRNIMNQKELVNALKENVHYEVQQVRYHKSVMNFTSQLNISYNSDIFICMHGAGLTHLIFQPDWGVVFELYNCKDSACYRDLASLRGIHYMTWERQDKLEQEDEGHHPTMGAHAKFTNYSFDVTEFLRLVRKAADHVRSHVSYKAARDRHKPASEEL